MNPDNLPERNHRNRVQEIIFRYSPRFVLGLMVGGIVGVTALGFSSCSEGIALRGEGLVSQVQDKPNQVSQNQLYTQHAGEWILGLSIAGGIGGILSKRFKWF
ncbi:MAG: hypothetical protein Q7R49_03345 [Candidatus Daviesbacteria bacterium]|nr:hypothetical protein [Candidatus Daviesbacteria bacterium]